MAATDTARPTRPSGAGGPDRTQVSGLVLCGGHSRRMGRDKALLPLAGQRLIDFPLAALEQVAGSTCLAVGSAERYGELGLAQVLDDPAWGDAGPLAGLLAGLEAAPTEWVCVLACDMPCAGAEELRGLLAKAAAEDLDACLLSTEQGVEPLFAVYRCTCAPAVRAALVAGERRMTAFHCGSVGDRPLRVGELRIDAPAGHAAANLNTLSEVEDERLRRGAEEPSA